MPRDYRSLPPDRVRRHDRAVDDDAWIRAFLHRAPWGVLATVHDGQPFVNANLFVYDEAAHAVYLHTARAGRTPANLATPAKVCFSVSEMGRLLPAEEALHFSVEYAGVVVFGEASVVEDDEAARALQRLLDKYAPHLRPGRDYRPVHPDELRQTNVYRLAVTSWSGKRKEADAAFPGAYRFEDVRAEETKGTA